MATEKAPLIAGQGEERMVKGRKFAEYLREEDIQLNESFSTEPVYLGHTHGISVQVFVFNPDSTNGTLKFQVSNDNTNWHNLVLDSDSDLDTVTNADGYSFAGNINDIFEWCDIGAGAFRVKYEHTSGSDAYMDLIAIRKRDY